MKRKYEIIPPVVGTEWKVCVDGKPVEISFYSLDSAKLYVKHMIDAENLPDEEDGEE